MQKIHKVTNGLLAVYPNADAVPGVHFRAPFRTLAENDNIQVALHHTPPNV